jgi:nucleoside-diphosphate-sugar epimerase
MIVAVTGANGFVGNAIITNLARDSKNPVALVRDIANYSGPSGVERRVFPELCNNSDFGAAVCGVNVLIHCAARVHIMNDTSLDSDAEFKRVNVEGTLNLARVAAASGVSRFVYLSSIKVNGESTRPGNFFTADGGADTNDPYGLSKYEAEKGLLTIAEESGMELVIIRPAVVYGSGVKGNVEQMLKVVRQRWPLPFGLVKNRRSMIGLGNLVDFILLCSTHPAAAGEVFLASDGIDYSFPVILRTIAGVLGKRSMVFNFPIGLLKFGFYVFGLKNIHDRIFCSLQIDISKNREILDWVPRYSMEEEFRRGAK